MPQWNCFWMFNMSITFEAWLATMLTETWSRPNQTQSFLSCILNVSWCSQPTLTETSISALHAIIFHWNFLGFFLQTHTFLLLSLLDFLQLQQDKPKRIHIQLQVIAFFFFFSLIYSSSFYPAAQKFISSAGMHRTVGHLTSLHNACAPLCGTTTHISVICRNVCLLGPDCQTRFRSCVDAFG